MTDPAAIDLEPFHAQEVHGGLPLSADVTALVVAVEALRERVAELEGNWKQSFQQNVTFETRAEASEAQVVELQEAVVAGKKLSDWIAEAISKAEYEAEERKNPDAWNPLRDAMVDGWMASFRDQFDAALSALPAKALERAKAREWQSMETAPENGSWVFLFVPGHGPARARWSHNPGMADGWRSHNTGRTITKGTHWMPLPAPPEDST